MTILIPSYEPDEKLLKLIRGLIACGLTSIVIVDDGSGAAYAPIFYQASRYGCQILTHPINQGKGCALKTGFRYLIEQGVKEPVICADSDGQHLPRDIQAVARSVEQYPGQIILGSRRFTGKVPIRSRFGNAATRLVFRYTTGHSVQDTQTGLRGYSASMLQWLCQIPGERFEYEMNMLLEAGSAGYGIREILIHTVYIKGNKSSHFRPLIDSAKVYAPIVKFSASSLSAALIDLLLLFLLQWLTSHLFIAVAGARLCSSIANYAMNRRFVFTRGKQAAVYQSMPKYFALVLLIMLLNYGLMYLFHQAFGTPLIVAKLLTECSLFLFSFWCQRRFVY